MRGLRALAIVVAVSALMASCGDSDGGLLPRSPSDSGAAPTSAPTTEPPSTTDPATTVPPPPSADPADVTSYYTLDGSTPALFPTCNGLFNLCLGAPIDTALALLGTETTRYPGVAEGEIGRQWSLEGMNVNVVSDSIGSITSMSVAIADPAGSDTPGLRVALPEGFVLGAVTMGDVVTAWGEPTDTSEFSGENTWFYSYLYVSGPEGTEELEFTHAVFGQELSPDEVRQRPVTSFSAGYDLPGW